MRRKLSTDAIQSIREDNRPFRAVAAEYGLDASAVSRIKSRQLYADVPELGLLNNYHLGDALAVMERIPAGLVRCVVTSPPYNKGEIAKPGTSAWAGSLDYEADIDEWDTRPRGEYIAWQREFIGKSLALVGESGAVFYNTKFQPCDLGLDTRHEIAQGFPLRQIIIWDKRSAINTGGQEPTILPPSYEVVMLFAGRHWAIPKGARAEARKWRDVWQIAASTCAESGHRASFPVELARRCIKLGGGAVLDPFAGSGATGLAAVALGVPYILIDQSAEYKAAFSRRLAAAT